MTAGEDPEAVAKDLETTVLKRMAEPEEIANVIVFLLSGDASFITAAVYTVDGGWHC